jgi:hypothetical protein
MSLLGGRGGRADDWSTPHLRARARAAERLDSPLDPVEDAWLDDHLAGCSACAGAAADYASQRLELRTLRDRPPSPPRDLWARTAAGIEREAALQTRHGRRSGRSLLAPYALLAGALIVAVAVGSLSLSQFKGPVGSDAAPASDASVTNQPTGAAATPIQVIPGSVAYLSQTNGKLQLNHLEFTHVCGPTLNQCGPSDPADTQTIGPVASPDTVFGASAGAGDRPLVVVSKGNGSGGKVYAIAVASQLPAATATPSVSATATATVPPTASAGNGPTATPTVSAASIETPKPSAPVLPSESPAQPASPTPSIEVASPPPASVVEIARDLKVLDTTAAYAPDGSAFAFTARPEDGSHGPDIYLWRVGDARAAPITTDHRSVFGSWAGTSIVGSTVTAGANDRFDRPLAFILPERATEPTVLTQVGLAWRPVVDPTGRTAVYWAGRLEESADGLGWNTQRGRLVVGHWDDVTSTAVPSASASRDTAPAKSAKQSPRATPTAPADADQPQARSETTIASGPLTDWDARWDETGKRLAVWIADRDDPTVGRLSLYVIDPFDGKIDLARPPLADEPALAGFAITDGHLAWAAPPAAGSAESSVLVLAWTGDDFGKVESAPGDVILVR